MQATTLQRGLRLCPNFNKDFNPRSWDVSAQASMNRHGVIFGLQRRDTGAKRISSVAFLALGKFARDISGALSFTNSREQFGKWPLTRLLT
jgi:hypothetical protein